MARLFDGSAVQAHLLPGGVGRASALKLSYRSYQKASRVLATVSYELACSYGVEDELADIAQGRPKAAARSWRWGPEMREVAFALEEAGLPSDLAVASAAVMSRWGSLKGSDQDISQVLDLLHGPSPSPERRNRTCPHG
ncbi:DUF1932 domain-containing protein [Streptomyces sp. FIT100]|uniref:DUF1932 domain-containing protein n=1 Tax=Streptomyces sp. FIT100 TaxID=2837956 RepID=UPI0021C8FBB0|nr:DUF1932 domain-containing protein [Streptomyces sp. FIT100]